MTPNSASVAEPPIRPGPGTARWVKVTACDNIPRREGRALMLGDREIALFNLGDRFLAVENRCPHKGGPLSDGIVAGAAVVCPLHAWKLSLETGAVQRPANEAACIRTYATRIEDGIVWIELVSLPPALAGARPPAARCEQGITSAQTEGQ
jgi:nitrite reductase (NADH) small subunit